MSDPDITPEYVAEVFHRAFAPEGFWIEMGCVSLIVYEYLLTVRVEHKVIWGRKLTVPTVLFLINRYILLTFALSISLWAFVPWKSDARYEYPCTAPGILQSFCAILIPVCYTLFSALRVHAINNRNWLWTIIIACLGFVAIPQSVVGIATSRRVLAVPPPLNGCATSIYEYEGLDAAAWNRVAIASEVCIISMDIIVLAITWYRTAGIMMLARKVQIDTSLVNLMLRDGTVFFSLTLGLHIIVIVVDETRHTPLVLLTCTFMSIIMTRFILNLRMLQWSDPESRLYSLHLAQSASLRFSPPSILDNIGAPLDMNGENDDDHGDEHDDGHDDDNAGDSHEGLLPLRGHTLLDEYSAVQETESLEC